MKKTLKWIGILIAGLIGVIVIAVIGLSFSANTRLNKTYNIEPASLTLPEDHTAIARGEYIFNVSCAGCHGVDLSGTNFFEDPMIGSFPASNLTAGQGGIGSYYSDVDFVRAIRHGIGADGKALMVMPSAAFWHFSDEDLGAVIAYIKSAPPVDNVHDEKNLKIPGRVLMAVGAFGDVLAAESIDHEATIPATPQHNMTAEYGEYLVKTGDCASCHGDNLAGAQPPEPGAPFSSNITPGGVLSIWSAEDFINTMRTGITPYGKEINGNFMPYKGYGQMTDEDLTAMFLYLQSLPAEQSSSN